MARRVCVESLTSVKRQTERSQPDAKRACLTFALSMKQSSANAVWLLPDPGEAKGPGNMCRPAEECNEDQFVVKLRIAPYAEPPGPLTTGWT